MIRNNKTRKFGKSTMYGTGLGIGVCLIAWIVIAAGIAYLISNEYISDASTLWLIPAMQLVISFGGSYVAGKAVEEKKAMASVVCASVYLMLLAATTLLLFDSGLYKFAPVMIAVFAGAGLAILLNCYIATRPTHRKRTRYHKQIVQH